MVGAVRVRQSLSRLILGSRLVDLENAALFDGREDAFVAAFHDFVER
jgi:hypothetical protein